MTEAFPPAAFLAGFPDEMRRIAERLRLVVRQAIPEAIEAVRPGWHLIGYDVPAGRGQRYFGYVAPEVEHVHLGFEHGIFMLDPDRRLEGTGVTKQVRWLTFRPGDRIEPAVLEPLIREAARVARLSRAERFATLLDADAGPTDRTIR